MSRQKVDNDMITGLTSSKLTGAMPAIDASALTGVGDGITKNASDPATDTNPSGGVGTLWLNTTDSNLFACTDATAGSNVWTNIGAGTGDVEPLPFFQGTIAGYVAAGDPDQTRIERFSLTSQANSVDIGDLATNAVVFLVVNLLLMVSFVEGIAIPGQPMDKFLQNMHLLLQLLDQHMVLLQLQDIIQQMPVQKLMFMLLVVVVLVIM